MRHKNNTMASHAANETYEVGYGKPPQHSRFKVGRSGKPRGRPKGAPNLITHLVQVLKQTVAVTEQGKPRKISKGRAGVTHLVNKAAQGDLAAIKLLLSLEAKREENLRAARGADQGGPPPTPSPGPMEREIPDFEKMSTVDMEILMQACWIMDGKKERPPVPMPPEDPGAAPDDAGGKTDDPGDKEE